MNSPGARAHHCRENIGSEPIHGRPDNRHLNRGICRTAAAQEGLLESRDIRTHLVRADASEVSVLEHPEG